MFFSLFSLSSLLLFGTCVSCSPDNKPTGNKNESLGKPNVLFLFADDQRADALECSGNSYIKTPNIDHYHVPCRSLDADGKLSEPVKKGYSTDLFADAAIGYLNNYSPIIMP